MRAVLEVADIFRIAYRKAYADHLAGTERRVMAAIEACPTPAVGRPCRTLCRLRVRSSARPCDASAVHASSAKPASKGARYDAGDTDRNRQLAAMARECTWNWKHDADAEALSAAAAL